MDKGLRANATRTAIFTGTLSLALLLGGCGSSAASIAVHGTPMVTVQLIQAGYGFQATIPQTWTRRVWNSGAGSSIIEGTNAGSIMNTIWAVPQKIGVTRTSFKGTYVVTDNFSQYFSADIIVPDTAAGRTLAGRIFKSLKLYHMKRGAV